MKLIRLSIVLLSLLLTAKSFAQTCMIRGQCPAEQFCLIDINGRGECITRDRALQEIATGGHEINGHAGESCATNLDCREDEGLNCVHSRGYKTYGTCQ